MPATIEPSELAARLSTKGAAVDLIDVRTPAEFRAVHVKGARLLPLDQRDPEQVKQSRPAQAQGPTLVICKSGFRSTIAAEQLAAAGIESITITGGTDACVTAGLPANRGQAALSLDRQTRIAIGAGVFTGTLLGAFIHPWFLIVPAFMGAGLVFAGITDTCGMALMIAKMPWNR